MIIPGALSTESGIDRNIGVDDAALKNKVAVVEQTLGEENSLVLNKFHQDTGSQSQACNFEKLSQGIRLPSSSYGEPLLLDD